MQNPEASGQSAAPSEQALEWLAILESKQVSEECLRAFRLWLHENPAHRAAWEKTQAFWSGLDRLPVEDIADILAMGESASADTAASSAVVPRLHEDSPPADTRAATVDSPGRRDRSTIWRSPARRRLGIALAASLFLALSLWVQNDPAFYADHYTRVGEQRNVTLSDGSTVQLNTDTAVSLDFASEARRLVLHRGEAYFQVAAGARRPFEVATDFGTVRALGTAFSVRAGDGSAEVTVYEHSVSVTAQNGTTLSRLGQGRQVRFTETSLDLPQPADLHRQGAWRRRQLVFEDLPLAEVVRELNRYRPGRITILDADAARQRVTGNIDIRTPDLALQSLVESLPVASRSVAQRWVFIYTR